MAFPMHYGKEGLKKFLSWKEQESSPGSITWPSHLILEQFFHSWHNPSFGQIILCGRGCPVNCKLINSNTSRCGLDTRSEAFPPPTNHDNHQCPGEVEAGWANFAPNGERCFKDQEIEISSQRVRYLLVAAL